MRIRKSKIKFIIQFLH